LHVELRARLIVEKRHVHGPAVDAARGIDAIGNQAHRLLRSLSEKRERAGERQDCGQFVRRSGGWAEPRNEPASISTATSAIVEK